ncbi:MAG: hypothetical protein GX359_03020 [Clostridiales bacterium]|nr:hypothetical protein [Clostridiales bacterium]
MIIAKLCGFAFACMIGFVGFNHTDALAAESNIESITLSENDHDDKNSGFREEMKEAKEHWDSLTTKQKEKVYDLFEKELNIKIKIMEQLADYNVLDEDDIIEAKSHMLERFKECKANGEFPLSGKKCRNKKR